MDLIRENKQKKRAVFKQGNVYKKIWYFKDLKWLDKHVELLNRFVPGYLIDHSHDESSMWIMLNAIKGTPASELEHTPEFVSKVYNFCLQNIKDTAPFAHGDWVLSNIIVDGDHMQMCDWDNLNLWPAGAIKKKMKSDLKSAFGDKFDTTGL